MAALFQSNPEPYDLNNFTILLVEDSSYMQNLTSEMLKLFGVGDILRCDNAKEAIDLLTITHARKSSRHIDKIDIVLTDWLMPNGSGEYLVKWIRGHESDVVRFMPIIVISGYTTEKLTFKTRSLGVNEILVKPVSGKLIASRICSIIDAPRPFVQTKTFFGPDRRRRDLPYSGENRRSQKQQIVRLEI
ncbi:MAG: response regulator [Alphaproteobacteria bacterium]|nr:response regulator [Alphaproteobacteria bacterium]